MTIHLLGIVIALFAINTNIRDCSDNLKKIAKELEKNRKGF
ncbi:hypothetical protein [Enterococcus sp. BWB1-3]|nr:hypothetical protein [Enterococcus sp. BWB1-3]